ncbi:alpha/beta fold hydrolase [Streptomyces microflavus]|uniref:alpha/beta fold hydrolase n=1 Tax=Streptomyces microflavus TaxID=1919 RepID=UPI003445CB7B
MYEVEFDGRGGLIRWTEAAGSGGGDGGVVGAATVYVHGLGAMSAVYHAHVAAHPALSGRRSLFVDLPGHGISDRPADFGYTLEDHADALAAVLDAAGVRGGLIVGHSMGGSVSVVLAHRRPDLVSGLVLTEANLDPAPPPTAGSSSIAAYTEEEFVHGGAEASPRSCGAPAPPGRRPCAWRTRWHCTARPPDWSGGPPRRFGGCCWSHRRSGATSRGR